MLASASKPDTTSDLNGSSQFQIRAVVVLGIYGSGASSLSTALENLGVFMGDKISEYVEATDLADQLRSWWSEPNLNSRGNASRRSPALRKWLAQTELARLNHPEYSMVGCKHPLLALAANDLSEAWGVNTKFVWCHRPLDQAIATLSRRGWFRGHETRLQSQLFRRIESFTSTHDHLQVDHNRLLAEPKKQIQRIVEYLALPANDATTNDAVHSLLNPNPRITF